MSSSEFVVKPQPIKRYLHPTGRNFLRRFNDLQPLERFYLRERAGVRAGDA